MKSRLLLIFLLIFHFSVSQNRTCGMEEHMKKIMFNPVLKKQYEERQAKFQVEYKKLLNKQASSNSQRNQNTNATIIIPVAVHFPAIANTFPEEVKARFIEFAQSQIDVINADYNGTNSDIANWTSASSFYPGVVTGNLNIQFKIASINHPAGTGLVDGQKAVTFGTDFLNGSDNDTTWSNYMNFVVRQLDEGYLGYSPLGGSPSLGNSVVMNTNCYGAGIGIPGTRYVPTAPYNLGRTVTHELGHFFNLNHIFNSTFSNSCNITDPDFIDDTPMQSLATYGCDNPGSLDACIPPQKVLTMNYMNYADDACMYMFTVGQTNVMLAYLNTILSEYKTNVLSNTSFLESNFSIYPNPNNGIFTINFKSLVNDFKINLFDVTGKSIYSNSFKGNTDLVKEINFENKISEGIYFMNIETNEGLVTKKIIIE